MKPRLSDERRFLVDAARQALQREHSLAAVRAGLDAIPSNSLWSTATEAGWTGLLSSEAVGGADLGAIEALLVMEECGAVLADARLLGHLPAAALLEWGDADPARRASVASGEQRAALVAQAKGGPAGDGLRVEARGTTALLSGSAANVVDVDGADVLVVVTDSPDGMAAWIDSTADGVHVDVRPTYDATRRLANVRFHGAAGHRLAVSSAQIARAGHLQQALVGAETLGAAGACLAMAREHALTRVAFGRQIGSYQAIKHTLVEMLRRIENARSLGLFAGWAWERRPDEFGIAACGLRVLADDALYHGARETIFIHGAVGVTWEHDLSLYYRRAELTRRLLGGTAHAASTIADLALASEDRRTATTDTAAKPVPTTT